MKIFILFFFFTTSLWASPDRDLQVLKERFIHEIKNSVPSAQLSSWQVKEIEKWLKNVDEDGRFPDFDYAATKSASCWSCLKKRWQDPVWLIPGPSRGDRS